jgi:hypothetical protein
MRRMFFLCWLVIGLLLSGAEVPAAAHGSADIALMVQHDGHVDSSYPDHQPGDRDAPCHAVMHHHCNVALGHDEVALRMPTFAETSPIWPVGSVPMASLAQAPPLQPPSA